MTEQTPPPQIGNTAEAGEAQIEGQSVLNQKELDYLWGSFTKNSLLLNILSKSDLSTGKTTEVSVFNPSGINKIDAELTEKPGPDISSSYSSLREVLINAFEASSQEDQEISGSFYNPETGEWAYHTAPGIFEKKGVGDELLRGRIAPIHFLFGLEALGAEAEEGSDIKKQAQESAEQLKKQIEVLPEGEDKVISFEEFSKRVGEKIPEIFEGSLDDLSETQRLALWYKAAEDLNPQYNLVYSKEGSSSPDQQPSYSEKTITPDALVELNKSAEAINEELRQIYEPIFSSLNRGGEISPSQRNNAINALSAELILAPTLKEGEPYEERLPDVVYQQRLVSKLAVLEALSEDDESVSKLVKDAKIVLGEDTEIPTDEVVSKISSKFLAYACEESGIDVSPEEIASLEKAKVDISRLATMPEADRANFMKNLFEQIYLGNLDDEKSFMSLFNKVFEKDGSFKERLAIRMSPLLLGSKETFDSGWNNRFSELKPGTLEKIGRFAVNNSPPGLLVKLGKSLGRKETYSKQNLIMAGMLIGTLFPQLIASLLSEE